MSDDGASRLDRPGAGLPVSQGRDWDWRVVALERVVDSLIDIELKG